MIIQGLFNLIKGVINLIPFSIPSFPEKFMDLYNQFKSLILSGLNVINAFIDLDFWIKCAILIFTISNAKTIYNIVIWLLNLIPGVEIKPWQ